VTISPAARVTYLYAAGLSTAQIAARTGLPIDTIRRILGLAA
jgi:DNA-directed RNA polymerase specialized sigma24 family protein